MSEQDQKLPRELLNLIAKGVQKLNQRLDRINEQLAATMRWLDDNRLYCR